MSLSLSAIATTEKNKLGTDSVWLIALKIDIPGLVSPIRVVRNNEDITWDGKTWTAFPFEIDEISDQKGEVPRVNIRVSNISRAMEAYLQDYDTYTKNNGFSPIEVTIYVLNSDNLASSTPEVEHVFELIQPKSNSKWVTFTLGASNPFNRRFPQARILKNHCRYIFKDSRCGYTGAATSCDKTLSRCRALSNSTRFGAFPGCGQAGLRLV